MFRKICMSMMFVILGGYAQATVRVTTYAAMLALTNVTDGTHCQIINSGPVSEYAYSNQSGLWYLFSVTNGYTNTPSFTNTVTSTYTKTPTPSPTFTPTPTSTWTSTFTFVPTPVWISVIGNQTPSSSGQVGSNYLWACPQTAVYSMSITQLNIYVTGGTPGTIAMGVYSDAYLPNNLLGATGEVSVGSSGWVSAPLSQVLTVPANTRFWLVEQGTSGLNLGCLNNSSGSTMIAYNFSGGGYGSLELPVTYSLAWDNYNFPTYGPFCFYANVIPPYVGLSFPNPTQTPGGPTATYTPLPSPTYQPNPLSKYALYTPKDFGRISTWGSTEPATNPTYANSATFIEAIADSMVTTGLPKYGMSWIHDDDLWGEGGTFVSGVSIAANFTNYPQGLSVPISYCHARNLKFSLYFQSHATQASNPECVTGAEQELMNWAALQGVDGVMLDTGPSGPTYALVETFINAANNNSSGRPLAILVHDEYELPSGLVFGNATRTGQDSTGTWNSVKYSFLQTLPYCLAFQYWAGISHIADDCDAWIGGPPNTTQGILTDTQSEAVASMKAMLGTPKFNYALPFQMSVTQLDMLRNSALDEIWFDPLNSMCTPVTSTSAGCTVYSKILYDPIDQAKGLPSLNRAIAFLNGTSSPTTMTVNMSQIIPPRPAQPVETWLITDVWGYYNALYNLNPYHVNGGPTVDNITVTVPGYHAVVVKSVPFNNQSWRF